jgi:hypothetical protein
MEFVDSEMVGFCRIFGSKRPCPSAIPPVRCMFGIKKVRFMVKKLQAISFKERYCLAYSLKLIDYSPTQITFKNMFFRSW